MSRTRVAEELVDGHDQLSIRRALGPELHPQPRDDVVPDPHLAIDLEGVAELELAFVRHGFSLSACGEPSSRARCC